MIQIKVLSTFFQTTELTTHINIKWPKIAFYTLPFRLPITDATCLTPNFWDTRWNFLCFIYIPLLFFFWIFERWRQLPIGSSAEKKLQQLGVFLAMLWYAPLIQSAASLYDCVKDDVSGEYFLRADTSTECQYKAVGAMSLLKR